MSGKPFQASDSDGNIYRVTRQKADSCYYRHPGQGGMNRRCPNELYSVHTGAGGYTAFMCWATTTKLCSKRSAKQQVSHLVGKDGTQRYPHERLVKVEIAPHSAFTEVTEILIAQNCGWIE